MTFNELFIRLLININNRRRHLSHADYFYVGVVSENIELPSYIIETNDIPIKIISEKNIANFINYDLIVYVTKDKINQLQIQPLSQFYTPKYFTLDNSLKIIHITCDHFYIPDKLIYNDKFIYPIDQSISILKKESD